MEHHQVIICGGGPCAMTLALFLNRYGVKPTIIERREKRSTWSKAGTLQPRTIEVIEDLGLIEPFLKAGKIMPVNNLYDGPKKLLALDYAMLPSKHNYLLSIPQYDTERILEKALNDEGIYIRRGYEVIDLEYNEDKNFVTFRDINTDEVFKQSATYIIGADGGKSAIRIMLQEAGEVQLKERRRYPTNFIMGDFELDGYPFTLEERHTHFAKKHLVSVIPMPKDMVRIVAMQHQKISADVEPTVEEFSQIVEEVLGQKVKLSNPHGLSRFYPAKFMLDKTRVGNIFLLGDAAHIVSPISGQGINLAIEEAYNFAWKLGLVIDGKQNDALLNTFYPERLLQVKSILGHSDRNQSMVSTSIGNFFFRMLIRMAKGRKEKRNIINQLTLFDTHYEKVGCPTKKAKDVALCAGSRLTNHRVVTPSGREEWLFESLPYDSHTLIVNAFSKSYTRCDGEVLSEKMRDRSELSMIKVTPSFEEGDRDETLAIDEKSVLAERLKESPPLILARPDKCISSVHDVRELQSVIDENQQLLEVQLLVLV